MYTCRTQACGKTRFANSFSSSIPTVDILNPIIKLQLFFWKTAKNFANNAIGDGVTSSLQ